MLLARGQNPADSADTCKHMRHFMFNLSAALQDSLFAAGISASSTWNQAWYVFSRLHVAQVGDFHQQLVKEASPRISDNTPQFPNVLAHRTNRWITIKLASLGYPGTDQSWSTLSQVCMETFGISFHHIALEAVTFLERIVPPSVSLFMTSQIIAVRQAGNHRSLEPGDLTSLTDLACMLESNIRQNAGSSRGGSFAGLPAPVPDGPPQGPPNTRDVRIFPKMSKMDYDKAVARGPPSKSGKGLCPCGTDHWASECKHRSEHTRLKLLRGSELTSAQAALH